MSKPVGTPMLALLPLSWHEHVQDGIELMSHPEAEIMADAKNNVVALVVSIDSVPVEKVAAMIGCKMHVSQGAMTSLPKKEAALKQDRANQAVMMLRDDTTQMIVDIGRFRVLAYVYRSFSNVLFTQYQALYRYWGR